MFGRFRRTDAPSSTSTRGGTAVADRPVARNGNDTADTVVDNGPRRGNGTATGETTATRDRAGGTVVREPRTTGLTSEHMRAARARQRAEYGGINWGAAFFGWLVAVGLGAILLGLVAGAGAAIGLTQLSGTDAQNNAKTIGLGGGIALLIVLMIAYYAGGYVAGRMSRFDGARQGAGAWFVGLLITIALGVLAAVLGDKYNVLSQLNLPRIPIGSETLTTGGIIATLVVLVGSLLAAVAGGKVGERYHRRIDRVAVDA
jgi:amino acid transporter